MAVKNQASSALARLKNQAKTEGINYQMCLQLFFQEEFLRRLSHSKYRKNLVLKGGMFIYALTAFDSRPTRDMDFLMRSLSNDLDHIKAVMSEICAVQTENDYILLEVISTEQITLEKKYPGVKTKFIGHINNIRVPFSVDVGIDDIIVPDAFMRIGEFADDPFMKTQWMRFEPAKEAGLEFPEVLHRLDQFLHPIYDAILKGEEFGRQWSCSQKAWE